MKKTCAFVLLFLTFFVVSGCSNDDNILPLLETPQISSYSENLFEWSSVNEAESYTVRLDNKEYLVNAESFIAFFNESKTFTFSIKANGDHIHQDDSNWSTPSTYTYVEEEILGGTYEEITGIGKGIDVVSAKTIANSIKVGSSVFDESQIDDVTLIQLNLFGNNGGNNSSREIEDITSSSSTTFSMGMGIEASYEGFTAGISAGFESGNSTSFSSYTNQYYFYQYQNIEKYSLSLPNYDDIDYYTDMLSDSFNSDVDNLEKGIMSCEHFIAKYGTHVIASGIFGGKMEAFYSVVSNSEVIDTNTKLAIDSSVKAGISGVFEGNASTSIDLTQAFGDQTSNVTTNFYATGSGGAFIPTNSFESFSTNYPLWSNSFNNPDVDQSVLIDFTSDGLIPIWDLFLSNSTAVGNLQKYVSQYASDTLAAENNHFDPAIESSATYSTVKTLIRSDLYKITDSGRFNQSYDIIRLSDDFGLDLDTMIGYGYTSVDIKIELNVAEVDNGYQSIFLFATPSQSNSNNLLGHVKFEHSSGKVDKTWWVHYSNELFFDDIPLSSFLNNQFIIRYGASGKGDNTWKNDNLYITLEFNR